MERFLLKKYDNGKLAYCMIISGKIGLFIENNFYCFIDENILENFDNYIDYLKYLDDLKEVCVPL